MALIFATDPIWSCWSLDRQGFTISFSTFPTDTDMHGALAGVQVLDLSRLLPGPYCSMILADHGADVIAIEDARFREDAMFFGDLYRNKRHMSLNLKSSQGREIFYQLARNADVVLEGFRPGVVERLGVDYETLRAINPGIIYCAITGYGQTGAKRDQAGHDVNYLAAAGILDLVGEAGRAPVIPAVQIADILGGAMQAAVGILLALYGRERTGVGQYVDISMTDGVLGLLTLPMHFQREHGEVPARSAVTLSHRYGCYNTYRTRDGRFLAVGAVEHRFWQKLCAHLGRPEYGDLQYDEARRQEVIDGLGQEFAGKDLEQWQRELSPLDVCCCPVATMDEALASDLFRERQMVEVVEEPDGRPRTCLGVPVKLSATPGSIRTRPARFGEHTAAVLGELGYSREQIAALAAEAVV